MATVIPETGAATRIDGYPPIGAYAAIGDGRTIALVADDGAIEWLCLPTTDSPSFFGAAIDAVKGGRWTLSPSAPYAVERRYLERTNVLETCFTTAKGRVRVTDSLNLDLAQQAPWRELARKVECDDGRVEMEWRFEPAPDFARAQADVTRRGDAWVLREGGLQVGLQVFGASAGEAGAGAIAGSLALEAGDSVLMVLSATRDQPLPVPGRDAVERRLDATVRAWREWVQRHSYSGPWRDSVERSLLALKLLTDSATGAMAAAATTSLPEAIGGERNYDYRFSWVRDTTFALDAFMRLGFGEIAHTSFTWLLGAARHTHPRMNPVYRLDGTPIDGQRKLPLAGYRGSTPVHIGNNAGKQLQLGGWGDFVETAYLYARDHVLDPDTANRLADLGNVVTRIWDNEDAGLWELGDYAHYTSSKVSCWVVFDRLLRLADDGAIPALHVGEWRTQRNRLESYIEERLWSDSAGSYVQKAGSDDLDAAVLLNSRRGYGDAKGERMNATIDAIRERLGAGGPLLYRYSGMQDEENAFLACSFWLVEALTLAERRDEAVELMDELTSLSSDVGLFSEEMDPTSKEMRGNTPQALTHLSLLNAAALLQES